MIDLLIWVILGLLAVASVIDIKARAIPSALMTTIVLVSLALRPENIYFGLVAFLFSLLLYELDYFGGMADIKALVGISLLSTSIYSVFLIICGSLFLGFLYKVGWKYFRPNDNECPFVPVFLVVYIAMILGGLVA